jgi:hypothetical protein
LVPFVKQFVTHLQGPNHIHGLLGSLYRDKVCSKSGDEVVPGAVVNSVGRKGSILPVLGPFSCGRSYFEMGQGGGDFLRVATIEVAVQIVVALEGTEEVFCFRCRTVIWFGRHSQCLCLWYGHGWCATRSWRHRLLCCGCW